MKITPINLKTSFKTIFKGHQQSPIFTGTNPNDKNATDSFNKSKRTAQSICNTVATIGLLIASYLLFFKNKKQKTKNGY